MPEFEEWYVRERPVILSACLALSGDLDAAREAVDEAFTRALERWATVGAMASPGGWTQTVAMNYLRRRLRRRPPRRWHERDPAEPDLPDRDLWAAVGSLARRQQTAVVLRYVHDLSYEQIAEAMGITSGAVASTLAGAHRNLARLIARQPAEQEEATDG